MRHAFLIIAHHDFEMLQRLLIQLDDERNDIYIHFDKKIKKLPEVVIRRSRLYILEKRIDVRWGDISQIKSEFVLFEAAYKNGPYAYYHTLSGVDFPLKSQDQIHNFFSIHQGKEFIGFSAGDLHQELGRKVKKYHFFTKYFREKKDIYFWIRKLIRALALRIQYILGVERYKNVEFRKGTSWVSVTHNFVHFFLPHYSEIIKMYRYTFCADEIFLHTLCWNSPFRDKVFDVENEGNGCMRKIGWKDGKLIDWKMKDYEELINSNMLFARKFTSREHRLLSYISDKINGKI